MLTLAQHPSPALAALAIVAFEQRMASVTLPPDETRDPIATYNYMSVPTLQALTPNLNWTLYFDSIGRSNVTHVIVTVPKYFQALDSVVSGTPVSTLIDYLTWCLLHSTANYLASPFVKETFSFFGQVTAFN